METHIPAGGDLPRQQSGDQEPGDDEEGVNTDVTTVETTDVQVVQQHQNDRDSSQSLDLRSFLAMSGGMCHRALPAAARQPQWVTSLLRRVQWLHAVMGCPDCDGSER